MYLVNKTSLYLNGFDQIKLRSRILLCVRYCILSQYFITLIAYATTANTFQLMWYKFKRHRILCNSDNYQNEIDKLMYSIYL